MNYFCSVCNKSLKDYEVLRIGGISSSAMCPNCKGPCFLEKNFKTVTSGHESNFSLAMKFTILILIACGSFFLSKNTNLKSSFSNAFQSDTIVIEYNDGNELLTKLKQIKSGKTLRIHQIPQKSKMVDTGISCCDTAAVKAYMDEANKELEERNKKGRAINDEINKELTRIQRELKINVVPY